MSDLENIELLRNIVRTGQKLLVEEREKRYQEDILKFGDVKRAIGYRGLMKAMDGLRDACMIVNEGPPYYSTPLNFCIEVVRGLLNHYRPVADENIRGESSED